MVAARASGSGLSSADLDRIRDTLASGRKPKVSFTKNAGQIAGQIGQVVALTDPRVSDEWVVVRFGRDELPFSPTDLAIAPRQTPGRKAAAPAPAPVTSPVPTPREEPSLPQATSRNEPPKPPVPAAAAAPSRAAVAEAPVVPQSRPEPPSDRQPEARPAAAKAPGRKAARPKPPSSLTVTLTYTDGEWLVSATQGAKTLAKPYVVRPTDALKMVALLDVAGVHEAVEEIVSSARAEAQVRADQLRAELAEVEARLAELREQP